MQYVALNITLVNKIYCNIITIKFRILYSSVYNIKSTDDKIRKISHNSVGRFINLRS